jgi:hypothetical protein
LDRQLFHELTSHQSPSKMSVFCWIVTKLETGQHTLKSGITKIYPVAQLLQADSQDMTKLIVTS